MKLVLPMAGLGTRLRPHTWSKPKPLVPVAGKTVLAHFLDPVLALPDLEQVVLIVGYLGDQIRDYVRERYLAMSSEERFLIGIKMFDTARALVEASISPDLSASDRRREICRRFYPSLVERVFPHNGAHS